MSNDELISENIIDDSDYNIRYSVLTDIDFLKECLSDLDNRQWYPPSSDSDLDIFLRNWITFSRYKSSLTASYKDQIIGLATLFLMPYVKVAHLSPIYMVVKNQYSRRGVGHSLVKNIHHLAKTKFNLDSVYMEIYEGCPIEKLLKDYGYKELFFQKNFVEINNELKGRKVYEYFLEDN